MDTKPEVTSLLLQVEKAAKQPNWREAGLQILDSKQCLCSKKPFEPPKYQKLRRVKTKIVMKYNRVIEFAHRKPTMLRIMLHYACAIKVQDHSR